MIVADAPVSGDAVAAERWNVAERVAFRFCFLHLGLFCLGTQIATTPFSWLTWDVPDLAMLPPVRNIVAWVAAHVLHFEAPLVTTGSGSGDKAWDWTFLFCVFVFSIVATVVWSWLDRRRENYDTLFKWFRVAVRLLLAGQLVSYGFAKIFPNQMPYPSLYTLAEPFGNMSPMGVLWSSIGAAPHYEMFAGTAEAVAGILLLLPRTTLIGALLAAADMTQVFMLNMTYDVPVKILSFHLLLLAMFLIAPDVPRLARLFFTRRNVGPSREVPLFKTVRANRIAFGLQIAFALWVLGLNIAGGVSQWKQYGAGRPKSPLYGIWDVSVMKIDGVERAALATDSGRWKRIIFDYESLALVETETDERKFYRMKLDPDKKSIEIARNGGPQMAARFTYDRSAPDVLVLDGQIDKQPVRLELKREDDKKLSLVNRGFHWRQDYPFNR
jgi:uncharacterized membrane protein YphA (DoxX/SURF4 family)